MMQIDAAKMMNEFEDMDRRLAIALARAEAAERELAALKERTRWIPVSERLPEDSERVLFLSILGRIMIGNHVSYLPQWSSTDGLYYHSNSYANVTHWMPLPEPPEVE